MSVEQRMKSMSLRQFRERAAEIVEPIEIVVRDREGNFRVLGYYTPYMTYPPGAVELPPMERETEAMRVPRARSGVIKTPAEAAVVAATAVDPIRSFSKSAQLGRKK